MKEFFGIGTLFYDVDSTFAIFNNFIRNNLIFRNFVLDCKCLIFRLIVIVKNVFWWNVFFFAGNQFSLFVSTLLQKISKLRFGFASWSLKTTFKVSSAWHHIRGIRNGIVIIIKNFVSANRFCHTLCRDHLRLNCWWILRVNLHLLSLHLKLCISFGVLYKRILLAERILRSRFGLCDSLKQRIFYPFILNARHLLWLFKDVNWFQFIIMSFQSNLLKRGWWGFGVELFSSPWLDLRIFRC